MKTVMMGRNVKMIGVRNFGGADKLIDYYLIKENQDKIYAFSKIYTHKTYEFCKSGIRLNALVTLRSRDIGVMRLVKYTKVIMPYLAEEYSLSVA